VTVAVDGAGVATTVPNKERLALWTDALRSDKYEQTTSKLKDPDGYCCLGVACEVAVANGLDFDLEVAYAPENNLNLPRAVALWYGFGEHDNDPKIGVNSEGDILYATHVNDDLLWGFPDIADAIDKEYKVRETSV
jgi:hypothetical protein